MVLTEIALIVAGHSATSIFVTQTHIAVEFLLINKRRKHPFSSNCTCCLFDKDRPHFLGFLVTDKPLLYEQVEEGSCILRPGGSSAQRNAESGRRQCQFLHKSCFSLAVPRPCLERGFGCFAAKMNCNCYNRMTTR